MRKYTIWAALLMAGTLLFTGCGAGQKNVSPAESSSVSESDAEGSTAEIPAEETKESTENGVVKTASQEQTPTSLSSGNATDVKSVTITATGDCAIGRVQVHGYSQSFDDYYDRNGADYFMANVRGIFEEDDFTLVNCECCLTDVNTRVDKEYNIRGKPEYVQIFSGSSVEGATLGNNHSADYGAQSLLDTKENLTNAGIAWAYNDQVGTFETPDGIRIGFVSVSMLGDFVNRSAYMENGLKSLRDQVDLLIACPHMGVEKQNYANANQVAFFHNCVDWGADVVIGNHPHVLQGGEIYNGKVIMYSLGNFCFGANHNPSDYDTVLFQQTFVFADGKLRDRINAKIIPCSVSSESGNNNYQPRIYTEEADISRVIGKMNDFSASLGDAMYFDQDGHMITQ